MNWHVFRRGRTAGFVVCAISLASPVMAQSHAHYSRPELHRMMREAGTADQCRTLATWFREEETIFRGKAEAENREYERYKAMLVPAKFPAPADSARALGDYYSYKANLMAKLAVRFETQLSRLDPSHPADIGSASAPGTPVTAPPHALSENEKMLLDRIQRLEAQIERPRAQYTAPAANVHNEE